MSRIDQIHADYHDPDRYLPAELPEDAYHAACEGEGCAGCNNTGIDPVKEAEYAANAEAEASAEYEAYLESIRHPEEW